jgi:putative transposase
VVVKTLVDRGHPIAATCRALSYPRSSYYAARRPKQQCRGPDQEAEELAQLIRKVISNNPHFGYRRVWAHLKFRQGVAVGRNRVHRIMKQKRWQATAPRRPGTKKHRVPVARKRTHVADPKQKVVAETPDQRWATDLTKVYVEQVGWMNLIPVIDCCSARILSYVFSDRGRALEAVTALEDALLARFDSFDDIPVDLAIRSDNGSIFLANDYQRCIRNLKLKHEFTPYHCPSANGVVERWMRTFKQECAWCYTFETVEQAERIIGDWIRTYNQERMHSRLGYISPVEFENALQKKAA